MRKSTTELRKRVLSNAAIVLPRCDSNKNGRSKTTERPLLLPGDF